MSADTSGEPVPPHTETDLALSESTPAPMPDAVPDVTRRAYAQQWDLFLTWCTEYGHTALPATAHTLAEYVAHLADASRSPAMIEQAMAAIRTTHRAAGHDHQPDPRAARMVLRGHRRHRAEAGRCSKHEPHVTAQTLRAMVECCDPATVIGLRDRVVLVLGLALLGRRSELVALDLNDLSDTPDGIEVLLRPATTDQNTPGAVVAIPPGQHTDTDPVQMVRAWRDLLAEHAITTGRLLRSVTRHGRIGPSISGMAINDVVRRAAIRAELPHAFWYSAHSLRASGATAAYRASAPVSVIAAHGRWSPGSPVVLSYIRAADR